ncbi:MAG: ATP-binding protein [Nitrospirota bacterium]
MTAEKLLYKIENILVDDARPFDDKLHRVVKVLAADFKVKKCSLMLVNHGDLTLEVRAATNPAIIGCKRKLSDVTIATRALIDDAPFYADRKRLSFFRPPDATRYASEHSLSIPLKYQDKKIGVLNFTDRKDKRKFTKQQQTLALEIGKHLAIHLYAAQMRAVLERKVGQFEETVRQLERLDELKTSLTGFIIHDLKGPITTIMANLDMLSYEELTPSQAECVNLALRDVYKMQRMVMNILDVSKLEEGRLRICREEVDIYDLARREIDAFKNILTLKKMTTTLEGAPHVCFVDENLIGRTVSNLLINAIEHSPDHTEIAVRILCDATKEEVRVSISDQGPGIPDPLKERIFDKFFQVEEGKRQSRTTTGLGLTFCKLAVAAHGGRLWVEDAPAGGSTFVFTIPERLV